MQVKHSKLIVLSTIAILFLLSVAVIKFNHEILPPAIQIETNGHPTTGYPKAPIHVVVFEEPKCPDCKIYNNTVLPKIREEFIQTNKIMYTVIPVSFLPHSMPAAVAWLCVYNQEAEYPNQDLFFTYLDYMYAHQPPEHIDWATDDTLIYFALQSSPAIDINSLKNCVDKEGHRIQVQKNTQYGSQIMDGHLSTPTVYVDGIRLEDVSYSNMSDLIKRVLRAKGDRQ